MFPVWKNVFRPKRSHVGVISALNDAFFLQQQSRKNAVSLRLLFKLQFDVSCFTNHLVLPKCGQIVTGTKRSVTLRSRFGFYVS